MASFPVNPGCKRCTSCFLIPAKQSHDANLHVCFPVHLINGKFLQGILPDCTYNPTYTIKDFPLLRYQGLQFVCFGCCFLFCFYLSIIVCILSCMQCLVEASALLKYFFYFYIANSNLNVVFIVVLQGKESMASTGMLLSDETKCLLLGWQDKWHVWKEQ